MTFSLAKNIVISASNWVQTRCNRKRRTLKSSITSTAAIVRPAEHVAKQTNQQAAQKSRSTVNCPWKILWSWKASRERVPEPQISSGGNLLYATDAPRRTALLLARPVGRMQCAWQPAGLSKANLWNEGSSPINRPPYID